MRSSWQLPVRSADQLSRLSVISVASSASSLGRDETRRDEGEDVHDVCTYWRAFPLDAAHAVCRRGKGGAEGVRNGTVRLGARHSRVVRPHVSIEGGDGGGRGGAY